MLTPLKGDSADEDVEVDFSADRVTLRQAELGTAVDEVRRKMGISQATFFRWKQKYGGLGPSELRKLRQLKEENLKLKWLSPT